LTQPQGVSVFSSPHYLFIYLMQKPIQCKLVVKHQSDSFKILIMIKQIRILELIPVTFLIWVR